jgi:NAD(P)H-dependent flavin oxidoreductase YrpB (nitropropane dioxygenase family)
VGSVEAACRAVAGGVEAVVAQGSEAGGHNYGELPTFVQVPEIADAVSGEALVLAAGGVADGRQAAAALCLGADAVWVGTALVASPEANVHPEHRRRLVAASGRDSVLTSIFGPELPTFNPMRVLRNRVVDEYADRLDEVPTDRDGLEEIGRTLFLGEEIVTRRFHSFVPVPETTGDWEEMPWLAGQGVGLVRGVHPAGQIVEEMMNEAAAVLSRLGAGG